MDINFKEPGSLVPAIIQDAATRRVLMVGYMNEEALAKTLDTGVVTFFSRSRSKLWTKGETSGHVLKVKSVFTDCDKDAILVEAEPVGPGVCHEGYESCFFRKYENGEWAVNEERRFDPTAVYGGKS